MDKTNDSWERTEAQIGSKIFSILWFEDHHNGCQIDLVSLRKGSLVQLKLPTGYEVRLTLYQSSGEVKRKKKRGSREKHNAKAQRRISSGDSTQIDPWKYSKKSPL